MTDMGLPPYVDGMTGDKSLSKAVNRGILVNLLRREGSVSRAALAKLSGLNKATVSSQIAELIDMGIVLETGAGKSEMGRKPVMLEIRADAGYCLGISILSESLHAVLMDLRGRVILDELSPLKDCKPGTVARGIQKTLNIVEKGSAAAAYGLFGLALAVPGVVDRSNEHVIRSAKLNWTDVPIGEYFRNKFDKILHIGNDSTLATIAERELFYADTQDLLCVLIDEGIGSGAYIGGAIHYGHNGRFGEVGHVTIMHGGRPCPCGNRGCWDLYGTELVLRQRLKEKKGGDLPGPEALTELSRQLPRWSRAIFHEFVEYTATGIVSLINAFAPDMVIINSAVLAASSPLFDLLKEKVAERTMPGSGEYQIRISSLGKAAPAMGACIAVTERFFHNLVIR